MGRKDHFDNAYLNPNFYLDSGVREFAEIVSDEIENGRVKSGGDRQKGDGLPLSILVKGYSSDAAENLRIYLLNSRSWYEFLTDLEVVKAISSRIGVSVIDTLGHFIDLFNPPNWAGIYWMRAYCVEVEHNQNLLERQVEDYEEIKTKILSERAKAGAKAKHLNSQIQIDKAKVKELWDDWKKLPYRPNGDLKYGGNSEFARNMVEKFESLVKSQVSITRWCTRWDKESK